MTLPEEVETFLEAYNDQPAVYIYFRRSRRNYAVILYRRIQGKNYRCSKIFHNPDEIYLFVEELCNRGCDLKTALPPPP